MCKRMWPSEAPEAVAFWPDASPWIYGQRKRVAHNSTGTTTTARGRLVIFGGEAYEAWGANHVRQPGVPGEHSWVRQYVPHLDCRATCCRAGEGQRRDTRCPHHTLEQRPDRKAGQPIETGQAPDVWPCQLRLTPTTHSACGMIHAKLCGRPWRGNVLLHQFKPFLRSFAFALRP